MRILVAEPLRVAVTALAPQTLDAPPSSPVVTSGEAPAETPHRFPVLSL